MWACKPADIYLKAPLWQLYRATNMVGLVSLTSPPTWWRCNIKLLKYLFQTS